MLLLSFLGFLFIHQAATLPSHGPSMPERAYVIRLAAESEHPDKLSQRDDLHIAAFHKRPSTLAYTVRYEFKHPHVFLGISIQTTGTETDEKTFSQLQALSRVSSISRVDRVSLPITQGSPQISAPGGHILSTWPLGPIEGYSMMYGTSMATPYISGAFALVGSRFPNAKTQEILERLQTTATPPPCVYNSSMLAATPQQGPGVVDVYKTTFSESQISPSQITVTDVSRTKYGKTNVTIQNTSTKPKTYSFSQRSWVYGLHLEIPRAQSAASVWICRFHTVKHHDCPRTFRDHLHLHQRSKRCRSHLYQSSAVFYAYQTRTGKLLISLTWDRHILFTTQPISQSGTTTEQAPSPLASGHTTPMVPYLPITALRNSESFAAMVLTSPRCNGRMNSGSMSCQPIQT